MLILKILASVLLLSAALIAGLFFFFVYVPVVPQPPLSGEFTSHDLLLDSRHRQFHAYVPADLPEAAPLVFVLHGSGSNGRQLRSATGYEFDQLADSRGFIAVYPEGYQNHWNDCRGSADYAANTENVDDIAFVAAMIEHFQLEQGIAPDRVFATGHSNGGHLAYKLALEAPGMVAAIAPIGANLPVDANLDCDKSGEPVPVAIFNGTEDPVNPYEGGLVEVFGNSSRGHVMSSMETAQYWAGLAGISSTPESRVLPEGDGDNDTSVELLRWSADSGDEVRLYTLTGSGHVIPSRIARFPRFLGRAAGDISGPAEIMDFFLGPY